MISWNEIVRTAKILVVDDDRISVRVITAMLENAGYQHIWSTDDPVAAPDLFRQIRPDLMLLDLHMVPIDGMEVMHQLQDEIRRDAYLPVLIVTGDESDQANLNALLTGAKDLVIKPIDRVETMLRVRAHLETRFLFLEMARTIERLRGPYG
jgi:putative two-component system response regulator